MAIISISGYAESGKDTVGKMIQNMHSDNWEIKKWAGKLKEVCSLITGIPIEKFEDQEFKKTNLGSEWDKPIPGEDWVDGKPVDVPMTVRDLLQRVGTDAMRDGLHENVWVNALMSDYKPTRVQWADGPLGGFEDGPLPNWIITDTRFPNEAEAVRKKDGIVVRVERMRVGPINNHPSEMSLEEYPFDYIIYNNGSISELEQEVRQFMSIRYFASL